MRPVGGGVAECVRVACTTPQGPSVTGVPRATSQTPGVGWIVPMRAYVSEEADLKSNFKIPAQRVKRQSRVRDSLGSVGSRLSLQCGGDGERGPV